MKCVPLAALLAAWVQLTLIRVLINYTMFLETLILKVKVITTSLSINVKTEVHSTPYGIHIFGWGLKALTCLVEQNLPFLFYKKNTNISF